MKTNKAIAPYKEENSMLIKAQPHDVLKYSDYLYSLALDPARSGYPSYTDGIKTKEEFIASARQNIERETSELLLFLPDDTVEGWIGYFWIPEEHYLQLNMCHINRKTPQALTELLELLQKRFIGYTLYFGFPGDNTDAVRFLQDNGFLCIEEDWNYSFFFDHYELLPENEKTARIDKDNFDDFRAVYHTEEETYWNCDRILKNLDGWIIYIYYQNRIPAGTIFLQGDDEYCEIFGIEFANAEYQADICRALLIAALNHCKCTGAKYLTFLCEDEHRKLVQELGFSCVGKYVCYLRTI